MNTLENKTFLITGGSSGLGAACARMVVGAGGNVVLLDVKPPADAIHTKNTLFAQTDVTDEASMQAAIDAARAQFGAVHGAINCAGIAIAERLISKRGAHALSSYSKVIAVNLIGTFNVVRLAALAMQDNTPINDERGVIINTASVAAFDGQIGQVAYAASKGGVAAMTLPLARDLARFGIRVMCIAPGIMDTPMLAGLPEAARASLGQQVPFPARLGSPDEYAALARHIIENQYLNGEVIRMDGAIRMAPQ